MQVAHLEEAVLQYSHQDQLQKGDSLRPGQDPDPEIDPMILAHLSAVEQAILTLGFNSQASLQIRDK